MRLRQLHKFDGAKLPKANLRQHHFAPTPKGDVAQPLHHPLWRWRKVGATAQPRGPGRNEKMSAIKIELRDYLETLRGIVPDDLHPHGMMTIWGSTFL